MYKTRKYLNGAIDTSLLDLASEVFEVLGENPELEQAISERLSKRHRIEMKRLFDKCKVGEINE